VFSPDGWQVQTANEDEKARLWDIAGALIAFAARSLAHSHSTRRRDWWRSCGVRGGNGLHERIMIGDESLVSVRSSPMAVSNTYAPLDQQQHARLLRHQIPREAAGVLDEHRAPAAALQAVEESCEPCPCRDGISAAGSGVVEPFQDEHARPLTKRSAIGRFRTQEVTIIPLENPMNGERHFMRKEPWRGP
jgi:hypothetical protein